MKKTDVGKTMTEVMLTDTKRGLTQAVSEVFEHFGRGKFLLASRDVYIKINGRVHIAGNCAIPDYGVALQRRLGKCNVTMSPGCNDLALSTAGLCKQMGIHPLRLPGEDPVHSAALLIVAKLKGSQANIVPLI